MVLSQPVGSYLLTYNPCCLDISVQVNMQATASRSLPGWWSYDTYFTELVPAGLCAYFVLCFLQSALMVLCLMLFKDSGRTITHEWLRVIDTNIEVA